MTNNVTPEQNPDIITDVVANEPKVQEQPAKPKGMHPDLPEDFDFKPASIAAFAMRDSETHPDMVGACRQMLVGARLTPEQLAVFDSDFILNASKGKSMLAQRQALNSFWMVQFSTYGVNAYGPRQMLLSTGNYQNWFDNFKLQPLDFIIEKGLPKRFGIEEEQNADAS